MRWVLVFFILLFFTNNTFAQSLTFPDTIAYENFDGLNGHNIEGDTLDTVNSLYITDSTWNRLDADYDLLLDNNAAEHNTGGTIPRDNTQLIGISLNDSVMASVIWRNVIPTNSSAAAGLQFLRVASDSGYAIEYSDATDQVDLFLTTSTSGSQSLIATFSFDTQKDDNFWYRFTLAVTADSIIGELRHYTSDNFSTILDTLIKDFRVLDIHMVRDFNQVGIFSNGGTFDDIAFEDFYLFANVIPASPGAVFPRTTIRRRGLRRKAGGL